MKSTSLASSLALAAGLLAATPARAQATDLPQFSGEPADQIIVTGTRRVDRTVTESSVPVDVFTEEAISTIASGDMNDILKTLVPSFSVGRFMNNDGSVFVRPPTLRGLPPDETLVLVNGKRRHRSALVQIGGGSLAAGAQGVDLAQIPSVAIQNIEVLRDGAAAQYGSDAIAGVLNFTLKKQREGLDLVARVGQYYEGDGRNIQISGNMGLPLGPDGYLNISGEYLNGKQTVRSVQRPDAKYMHDVLGLDVRDPTQIAGIPSIESGRLFVNGGIPLGDAELYFFGNYGVSDQEDDFAFRRPVAVSIGGQSFPVSWQPVYLDKTGATYNGQPVYNGSGKKFSLGDVYPAGYTPRFKARITDISGTVGYRGEIIDKLKYDVSASFGKSRIGYSMSDSFNPSLGPDSPTSFYLGSLEQRETNFNVDLTYPVDIAAFASPLYIAVGGEYRREAYQIGLGDAASYAEGAYLLQYVQFAGQANPTLVTHSSGADGFPGFGPNTVVNQDRKSRAAYIDLETDIVKSLTIGVAGRYEHFSDFGATWNWKVSGRYALNDAIAVRAAASTGFRAPTPGQLFTKNVRTIVSNGAAIARATLPVSDPAAIFYGASPLKPEKSDNLSAGVVLTPGAGFTVTLDYYNIKVRDRIGISSYFTVSNADRTALQGLGVSDWANLGQVQYFTNAFDTRTQGVDLVASHAARSGNLKFNTTLAANYNETKVTDRDITVINNERKGDIEELNPKWRATLTENLSAGPWSLMLRGIYYGKLTDYDSAANGGNQTYGDEFQFDAEIGYTFSGKYTLSLGAQNILDNYPDKENRLINSYTNSTQTGQIYPDASPLAYNGGFYYLRIAAKF